MSRFAAAGFAAEDYDLILSEQRTDGVGQVPATATVDCAAGQGAVGGGAGKLHRAVTARSRAHDPVGLLEMATQHDHEL